MGLWQAVEKNRNVADREYSREAAHMLSVVSAWAYSPKETFEAVLRRHRIAAPTDDGLVKAGCTENSGILVDTNYYLCSSDEQANPKLHVLAFRGTQPDRLTDVLTDALATPQPWLREHERMTASATMQWVHRGFYIAIDAAWPELKEFLTDTVKEDDLLLITGHSLGGALAVLAARRAVDDRLWGADSHNGPLRGVYTFGQPMVGNRYFASACDFEPLLFRHVYGKDLVPSLPPEELCAAGIDPFQHFGELFRNEQGCARSPCWRRVESCTAGCGEPLPCSCAEALSAFLPGWLRRSTVAVPLNSLKLSTNVDVCDYGGILNKLLTQPLTGVDAHHIKLETNGLLIKVCPESPPAYSIEDHLPTSYVAASKIEW